jgi:hypothetical protein
MMFEDKFTKFELLFEINYLIVINNNISAEGFSSILVSNGILICCAI